MSDWQSGEQCVDEELRKRFEEAWHKKQPIPIADCLPPTPHPQHLATLEELVHIELEYAWKDWSEAQPGHARPQPCRVEDYFRRFSQLNQPAIVQRLIRQEYYVRHRWGDQPSTEEYRSRFPHDIQSEEDLQTRSARFTTLPDRAASDMPEVDAGEVSRGNLRVHCPQCHGTIGVGHSASLREITCSSCGFAFSLVNETETVSHQAKKRKLGHFELLDHLGMGQFGNVWRAHDSILDRIVALKIPRGEHLDDELFFREARAAAQLQHPNIVSVHEVGREGDTVYIACDFVQGANLDEWLGKRRISLRAAAELCLTIAEALHHAHESGVVHRDLKPSNVMMDTDGRPHLMDFGLAKRESGEITMTVRGQILGTPAYMSPEQARGEGHQADRRTDIYSLGVVLYQLLTGELPFRGERAMLIVQILSDDPVPPRRLNGRIPRDLETICLKCLQKPPERRYLTAAELAADLGRWLKKEPIKARPVSRRERVLRWCQRHPAVAVLLALVVGITALGLGLVTWQWRQTRAQFLVAERQRTAAQQQRERGDRYYGKLVEAVDKMLLEVGAERLKDEPHSADIRRTLTEEALAFYVWLSQQEADDDAAKSRLASTFATVGKLQYWLGENERAEDSFGQALRIVEQLKKSTEDSRKMVELELSARFLLAELFRQTGRAAQAEQEFTKNLKIAAAEHAKDPEHAGLCVALARNLTGRAVVLEGDGRRDEADHLLEEAIEVLVSLAQRDDLNPSRLVEARRTLAQANHTRANLLSVTPRFRESDAMYRESISLYEQIGQSDPEHRETLASVLGDWAKYLHYLEDSEKAETARNRAIALHMQLIKDHPSVPAYRYHMAIFYQNYGYVLAQKRRFEDSQASHRQALDLLEELARDYPDIPRYREVLASTWNLYASPVRKTDGDEAAAEAWKTAREHYLELLEKQPDDAPCQSSLAAVLNNLFGVCYRQKDYEQAVSHAGEAIYYEKQAQRNDPTNTVYHDQLASHYARLALGLTRLKDYEAALRAYEESASLTTQLLIQKPDRTNYHHTLGAVRNNMALICMKVNDYLRAESLFRDAVEHQETALAKSPKHVGILSNLRNHYANLARLLQTTDRSTEAVEAFSKALVVAGQVAGLSDGSDGRDTWVAMICELSRYLADPRSGKAHDLSRSAELIQQALEIDSEAKVIPYSTGVIEAHNMKWDKALEYLQVLVGDDQVAKKYQAFSATYLAMAHEQQGNAKQADESLQRARDIARDCEADFLDHELTELQALLAEVEALRK